MRVKVSENVVFYWKDGKLICDDFVAHEQVALARAAEPLLRWFAEWKELDSLQSLDANGTSSKLTRLAKQLLGRGILISEESQEQRNEERLRNWDAWRQSAKYFHFSIRTLSDTEFLGKQEDEERLEQKAKVEPPPHIYKEYPNATKVALPIQQSDNLENCADDNNNGLLEVLLRRRTCRSFDQAKSITKDQLSTLLYYAFGATKKVKSFGSSEVLLKTSPSGGARHPIEVYVCVLNVAGVDPGIYHYSVKDNNLELVAAGPSKQEITKMCGDQLWTRDASAIFFYTAMIERSTWKYQSPKVYRVLGMDLGHLSQTFFLLATWLQLEAFFVGALRDESVEKKLGLDWSREIVLGASGVGHSAAETLAEKTDGSIETIMDPS